MGMILATNGTQIKTTSPVEFMTLPQLPVRPLELPRACLLLSILLTLERVPAARLSGRGWRRLLVT